MGRSLSCRDGVPKQKTLDLLEILEEADLDAVVTRMIQIEPLLSENRRPLLRQLMDRLVEKISVDPHREYHLFKARAFGVSSKPVSDLLVHPCQPAKPRNLPQMQVLRAHVLPLTNCAFNKQGNMFITGSYDRTCKVWDTETGTEVHSLDGHK